MTQRHDADGLYRISPAELEQLAEDSAEKTATKAALKMAETMTLTYEEILFVKNLNQTAKTTRRQFWTIFVALVSTSTIIATFTALYLFLKSKMAP